MELDEYYEFIDEILDIKVDTSSFSSARRTLMELKKRRNILQKLKKKIKGDIRRVEADFIRKRSAIRREIEDYEENPSLFKKLAGKDAQSLRVKALKK